MQDLVGVRVADPAEEMGVGECALEGVVLALQSLGELDEAGVQHLESTAVERRESRRAPHDMERCAARRARFGEVEACQSGNTKVAGAAWAGRNGSRSPGASLSDARARARRLS